MRGTRAIAAATLLAFCGGCSVTDSWSFPLNKVIWGHSAEDESRAAMIVLWPLFTVVDVAILPVTGPRDLIWADWDSADTRITRAKQLHLEGDKTGAAKAVRSALEADPDHAVAQDMQQSMARQAVREFAELKNTLASGLTPKGRFLWRGEELRQQLEQIDPEHPALPGMAEDLEAVRD